MGDALQALSDVRAEYDSVLRGAFPEDWSRFCFFRRRGGEYVTAGPQTIDAASVEVAARCSPPTPPEASPSLRMMRQRERCSRRRTRERRANSATLCCDLL